MHSDRVVDNPDEITDRISFPKIATIKTYEIAYKPRVIQLFNQIAKDEKLVNPIIWDQNKNLIIDGHHRMEALSLLGLKRVPAYHVDYMSNDVQVYPWYRIISHVSIEDISRIFYSIKKTNWDKDHNGNWAVNVKMVGGKLIMGRKFTTCLDATEFLDWFYQICAYLGYEGELSAKSHSKKWSNSNSICIYLSPVVGKKEVLMAARKKELFPYQVNRHIVEKRLLNICYPLKLIMNDIEMSIQTHDFFQHAKFQLNSQATWFDNRFYQEKTIQMHH